MTDVVQEIRLDDQNRTYFARFRAQARVEIGEIEDSAASPHDSKSPSSAR
jgi:hypothetical protein